MVYILFCIKCWQGQILDPALTWSNKKLKEKKPHSINVAIQRSSYWLVVHWQRRYHILSSPTLTKQNWRLDLASTVCWNDPNETKTTEYFICSSKTSVLYKVVLDFYRDLINQRDREFQWLAYDTNDCFKRNF